MFIPPNVFVNAKFVARKTRGKHENVLVFFAYLVCFEGHQFVLVKVS